jgi:hypothetical protein
MIHDSALGHERDTTSSHLPHGPLGFFLLAQLEVVITLVNYYSLLGPHVRPLRHFRRLLKFFGVVTGGYLDH